MFGRPLFIQPELPPATRLAQNSAVPMNAMHAAILVMAAMLVVCSAFTLRALPISAYGERSPELDETEQVDW